MNKNHRIAFTVAMTLTAGLGIAQPAVAANRTFVSLSGSIRSLTTPNGDPTSVNSTDSSFISPTLQPVQTSDSITGHGFDFGAPPLTGSGFTGVGTASGFAKAAPGVLGVRVNASSAVVPRVDSRTFAAADITASALVTDTFRINTSFQGQLINASGSLLLAGDEFLSGNGSVQLRVAGTGVSVTSHPDWVLDCSVNQLCRNDPATGVFSVGAPLQPQYAIPFSFLLTSGQDTEISYSLQAIASALDGSPICLDSLNSGQCDVVQPASSEADADYSHTLRWGGLTVTTTNGTPLAFSASSVSGFDYSQAAAVPVPSAAWLFGSGLLGLFRKARRVSPQRG